ncbi:transcriptional regulator [Azospirillum sp. TSH100]|uniref:IclR family transcriptional regulator n=1 Tax=Azospirillum sp. TSH100 TaxID=652764 RepID=UPI000D6099F0|nr:IclR family transcriptional regulator [Azospirillum sp. TSH100]PWC80185.1 transcriptional regulator [Azospirillum sp. TSH100]QCG90042.1 IclR family transcriptional regulator [Azospirillum sp. TSH100]
MAVTEVAESEHEKPRGTGTQTLLRGLALLDCVAAGIGDVKGIAARLGTPRSTTNRMLASLVAEGYLHHIPYKGYLLGPKLIQLGMTALEQRPLVAIARPHLEQLARTTGDTIHLGVEEHGEVFYLDKIAGTRGLEMRSCTGQRMPLASTGLGKALMLGMPPDRWPALHALARPAGLRDGRPRPAGWLEFEAQMNRYVAQGWAMDLEENELGIRCVSAPLRDGRTQVVGAISVASAVPYMPEDRMAALGPLVRTTAEAISKDLGWTAP